MSIRSLNEQSERPEEAIGYLYADMQVIRDSASLIVSNGELVASALDSLHTTDPDIRWLQLHQQAMLLHTDARILMEARTMEIQNQINQLNQGA